MMRNLTVAILAVSLALPAVSAAQATPRRPSTRPRVRVQTGDGPFGVYSFSGESRGRIGVIVDTKANTAGDKIGARVEGITPGGPAEKAGIKAGDVITRFNGTALAGSESENDERSGPGLKLIDLAHELEPGDTVQVEYRRGNDARKATLVAEDLGGGVWTGSMDMPDMRKFDELMPQMDMGPGEFMFGGVWGGIELVRLNPDLGDYFGTREGVLVVRAPEDSSLALKGGDVILSIGDRKPTSPEQAMRILRSYDVGETVTLDVLRKQRHVAVAWKVPDHENRKFRMAPRMHEEPSRFRVMPKLRQRMEIPAIKIRDVIRTSRAI